MDQFSPFPSARVLGLAPDPSPPTALLSPWLSTKGPRLSCLQHSSLYCSESTAPPSTPSSGSLGGGGGGVRGCAAPLQQDSSLTSFDPDGGLRLKGPPFGPLPAGCWSIRWTCRTSASQLSGQSVCCDRSGPLTGCPVSDPSALSPWKESPKRKYGNLRPLP